MNQLLQGVVFITGAASGIGRGCLHGLAKYGIQKIAMGDINEAGLQSASKEIEATYPGVSCLCLALDVTSEEAVQDAIKTTVEHFGRIDIALNIAGIGGPSGKASSIKFEDWRRTIDVNVHGVWLCQRAQITQMLKQEYADVKRGRGVIVNMASMLGMSTIHSAEPYTAYIASKHAVVGLTQTDALTYASEGIRINVICPGWVETPLLTEAAKHSSTLDHQISRTPMGRPGSIEEIVDCIAFLASPMSSYMSGASLVVDGGYSLS